MKKTAIIVDSTSYLPEEIKNKNNIFQVELIAHFSDGSPVKDSNNTDYMNNFFDKMANESELPKTSQPSLGQYYEVVEKIVQGGYEAIIALHLSSGISGTFQTAKTVLADFQDQLEIHCIDTKAASVIIEAQVGYVLKSLEQGMSLAEISNKLTWLSQNTEIYLMVENLTNLAKGGRLSSTGAFLGNFLKIRPLLHFDKEGKIVLFEKIRTNKRVFQRWLELIETAQGKYPEGIEIRLAHSSTEGEMDAIEDFIKSQFPDLHIYRNTIGPVIATHTGPGTKAMAIIPKI